MPLRGRALALDVGTKTIGVAVSDALGITANAVTTVSRRGVKKDCALLAKIAADITQGKAPWKDIVETYRDAIHMNTTTGRYLMHNAMRHALGQPRSAEGFKKLDPKLKAYFDSVLDQLGDPAE